jgi:hypothetical protein
MKELIKQLTKAGIEYAEQLMDLCVKYHSDREGLLVATEALLTPTEALRSQFEAQAGDLWEKAPEMDSRSVKLTLDNLLRIREAEQWYRSIIAVDTSVLRSIPYALALANLRAEMDRFWNVTRQLGPPPKTYKSKIDPEALKALALLSTRRLLEIIKADD